jgi:signal transduction histidine kinase
MSNVEPDVKDSLRPVLHHVLLTHEEEKRTAALMLHDEIAQGLTLISLQLSVMRKQYAANPGLIPDGIAAVQEIISSAQGKVRELEFSLYPKVIELSLTEAVKGLLHRLSEERGYAIEYSNPSAVRCGRTSARGLYRVLESFFTRLPQGAHATWVVALTTGTAAIVLSIARRSALEATHATFNIDAMTREVMSAHGGTMSLTADPDRVEIVFPKE